VGLDLHPVEIDRLLRRAHRAWLSSELAAWQPDEDDRDEHPLLPYRSVTGQASFRAVSELPDADPMREPLRRWIYRLAEQRINQPTLAALARDRHVEHRHPDMPRREAVSIADLLVRALGDPPRREAWARMLLELAPQLSPRTVELWQRRSEVARRMGLSGPGDIESSLANAPAVADELSAVTGDRVRELGVDSLAGFFERAIGADVPGGWPARLSPNRLLDYFRDGDLLRSLSLETAPLPAAFGAASVCRALGQMGAAWYEALAPTDQPFVIAFDPYGLGRHTAAALFAMLPLNARFAQRHLDISAHGLADAQRRLAQLLLIDLALSAFRLRLRGAALTSERTFRETFSELAFRDLSVSLPPSAAGALFPLGIEDEQVLLGKLLAVARAEMLVEAHDEDWFRNPRAIEQLRAEARLPPMVRLEPEVVARALAHTKKLLERWLR
jgi:hypothetical protein